MLGLLETRTVFTVVQCQTCVYTYQLL